MNKKIIGIVILLIIVLSATAIYYLQGGGVEQVTLKGLVGGEKIGFLEDPQVKKILKAKYGITIDYSKAGSLDMIKEEGENDFLFPSSQIALEIFKASKAQKIVKSAVIINSPIVFYSWDIVVNALEKEGVVTRKDKTLYVSNFQKLTDMIMEGKKWNDIGIGEFGKNKSVTVISTDPTRSNSGNMFTALLAGILNDGVIDNSNVEAIIPKLKQFYSKQGFLQNSSSDLFNQYLITGPGANPIIAGYESQIIEYSRENPKAWQTIKDKVRILYPVPTVWSAHPVIVLKPSASKLIAALEDKDIQKIAWEKHGFRTGVAGIDNDISVVPVEGLPERIDNVMALPTPEVMQRIIQALETR
ncbi:MAG: substrate-binding domain-containing protein [Clostridia bacterium]|nr:substrate-binding domain-containing protein [Clostridia bacterium]